MANKYTKLISPEKSILEMLYFKDFLSQKEIADKYNTTQKVVWRWFRDLKIKSRVPYKRNQFGKNNSSWKGDKATYAACHYRVIAERGRPKKCEICGTSDENKIYDWANMTGIFLNINDYKRMCRSCHFSHDKIGNNFTNNARDKNKNKRKMFDGK